MPSIIFFGFNGETVVDKTTSDTYTLEGAIDAVSDIQRQYDVVDTETIEDAIDSSALDTTAPVDFPVSDTFTLEDAIDVSVVEVVFLEIDVVDTLTYEDGVENTPNVTIFINVVDTFTFEDGIDSVTDLNAQVGVAEYLYLEQDYEALALIAELVASDIFTIEQEYDTQPAAVRGSSAKFHIYIDWESVGNYVDYADCLFLPITYSRGVNGVNDKIAVGSATILMNNESGDFAPLKTSSPISPYVVGSVPFYMTFEYFNQEYILFTGFIWDITQDPDDDDPIVTLQCVDVVQKLSGEEIRDQLYEDEYTGNIFSSLLDSSFPHSVYEQLVIDQGVLGYWQIVKTNPKIMEDTFEEDIVVIADPNSQCRIGLLPALTGQPWIMVCGSNNVFSSALPSKWYWHFVNRNATDINPGVEVSWRNAVSQYHIFLVAETEAQNVIHRVTLDQTVAVTNMLVDTPAMRSNAYGALAVVRFTDVENCMYVEQIASGYQLVKLELDVRSVLDYVVMVPGVQDVIRIDTVGNDINVYINESLVMSATTSFNNTATKHGFGRFITPGISLEHIRFGNVTTLNRTLSDGSGNGHDGIYYGDPGPVFDGGKYADLDDPAVFDITANLTLGLWVKRAGAGPMPLVVKEDAYGIRLDAANKPYGFVVIGATEYTTPVTALTALTTTASAFLAIRRSTTSLELYIDGALAASVAIPGGSIDTNANALLIGKEAADVADAEIWDVSLASPALTAAQIAAQQFSKAVLGLNRSISRGRQQLPVFAPSGTMLWDAGQVLAFEELGGHCFVNGGGVIVYQDRWDRSREPLYASFDNCGLISAPLEALHDDNYDAYQARWKEFNTFDEDNQWIIWQSVVSEGENHARMNKLIKPGDTAPENTFVGSWETSGIQIRPGSIDPNTHISFIATTQPSTGLNPFDDATVDVEIAEFVYDDKEFSITFRGLTNEDRYIYNMEIKIAEGAIIQKLPIDFVKQRSSGFIRHVGIVRKEEFNWNDDGAIMYQLVNVRSKIGRTIHPRPNINVEDIYDQLRSIILLAELGKRIHVQDDSKAYSTYMNSDYFIVGMTVTIGENDISATWRLFDEVLAEGHYFIIGQSAIDSLRVITF